jgi:hypothetical protein
MTIDNLPQTTGSEVQTFIENTLNQISEGVKKSGFVIKEGVDFDLEVTERKSGEGSIGFKQLIKIGGKKEGENVQRVKFSARPEKDIQIHSIPIN